MDLSCTLYIIYCRNQSVFDRIYSTDYGVDKVLMLEDMTNLIWYTGQLDTLFWTASIGYMMLAVVALKWLVNGVLWKVSPSRNRDLMCSVMVIVCLVDLVTILVAGTMMTGVLPGTLFATTGMVKSISLIQDQKYLNAMTAAMQVIHVDSSRTGTWNYSTATFPERGLAVTHVGQAVLDEHIHANKVGYIAIVLIFLSVVYLFEVARTAMYRIWSIKGLGLMFGMGLITGCIQWVVSVAAKTVVISPVYQGLDLQVTSWCPLVPIWLLWIPAGVVLVLFLLVWRFFAVV